MTDKTPGITTFTIAILSQCMTFYSNEDSSVLIAGLWTEKDKQVDRAARTQKVMKNLPSAGSIVEAV